MDLVDYASEAQLRAFLRVFGLYGAREVGRRAGQALEEAVGGLQSVIDTCEPILLGLKEALQVPKSKQSRLYCYILCLSICCYICIQMCIQGDIPPFRMIPE
jgi:hypothetical protein